MDRPFSINTFEHKICLLLLKHCIILNKHSAGPNYPFLIIFINVVYLACI